MTVSLVDMVVPIDQLVLDPNNPRYADIGLSRTIPRHKVSDEQVQATALARMLDDRFEVGQLKESIEKMGFLRVDRLVVLELPEEELYMVVEGNRRLAAIKSLLGEAASGEIDLDGEVEMSLKELPAVLIQGGTSDQREEHARHLQGIRHIAGIKQWGPYQQALAVGRMIEEGMGVTTVKSALGLSTQRVNLLNGVYQGMKQMRDDPDYSEHVKPEHFSHFAEALKQPKIRDWLGWNKDEGRIENDAAKASFYQLIVGMEDDEGQTLQPKIVDAKDFRLLPRFIDDASFFGDFLGNPAQTVQEAARIYAPPPEPLPDWKSILRRDLATLVNNVPHTAIASAGEDDIRLLTELRDTCAKFLTDIGRVQEA